MFFQVSVTNGIIILNFNREVSSINKILIEKLMMSTLFKMFILKISNLKEVETKVANVSNKAFMFFQQPKK